MPRPPPIDWLLDGDPLVRYRTLVDLAGLDEADEEVVRARRQVLEDPRLQALLRMRNADGYWGTADDIHRWLPRKDTTFWVLGMLADFGLRREDRGLDRACEYVLETRLDDGGFGLRSPDMAYDCFTGVLAASLVRLGCDGDPRLEEAYRWIESRQRLDGGFWCKRTGQPGGPRQDEPSCALATLQVLGALAAHPEYRDGELARKSVAFLLGCWDHRDTVRYAGHDSRIGRGWEKLKYPFTDYRILAYLDTLTRLSSVRDDPRLEAIVAQLAGEADERGRYRPGSIHRVWSDFDFGQKKEPSRWITMLVHRIYGRCA